MHFGKPATIAPKSELTLDYADQSLLTNIQQFVHSTFP